MINSLALLIEHTSPNLWFSYTREVEEITPHPHPSPIISALQLGSRRVTEALNKTLLFFFFFLAIWSFHTAAPSSLWHEIPLCLPQCLFKEMLTQMKDPGVHTRCTHGAVSPSSCRAAERVVDQPPAPGIIPISPGTWVLEQQAAVLSTIPWVFPFPPCFSVGFSFFSTLQKGKPRCC